MHRLVSIQNPVAFKHHDLLVKTTPPSARIHNRNKPHQEREEDKIKWCSSSTRRTSPSHESTTELCSSSIFTNIVFYSQLNAAKFDRWCPLRHPTLTSMQTSSSGSPTIARTSTHCSGCSSRSTETASAAPFSRPGLTRTTATGTP